MADRHMRPSASEEATPLLADPEAEDAGLPAQSSSTLSERINAAAQEPLTPLSTVLLVVALVLLLLSSVFIGLFAGAQHKLNVERGRHSDKPPAATTVLTTATSLSTATTTATATATTTSTVVRTTTFLPAPVPKPTSPPFEKPCLEPHCIILSASILSSVDVTQDPCENFYEFANAGWLKSNPLPADKSSYGQFEALAQSNKYVIQRFLETNVSKSYDSSADEQLLDKLRALYASCINEEQLDDVGHAPLKQFIHTVRSLFREDATALSSNGFSPNATGLTAALAFLHSRGVESLFNFEIEGDVGVDPNHMTLWFTQSSFTLPSKEYYSEKHILRSYRNIVEQLLLILDESESVSSPKPNAIIVNNGERNAWPTWPWPPWGDDEDGDGDDDGKTPTNRSKVIHRLSKDIVAFEHKLAKASLDLDILYQDPIATYNPVRLQNLTDTLPEVDFHAYFSSFTPRSYPERVIVTYPSYASNLSKILNDTAPEVVEGYLVIRAALALSEHLGMSTEAWQSQRELLELLSGIKKGAVGDRSEYCIGKVEDALGFASGRFFVNETFGGESKEKGTKVITDIIKAFKTSLPQIDWMDKASSKAAAEKADAIRVKVGYPLYPDTQQPEAISRYYNGVKIDRVNFFDNMLSAAIDRKFKEWLQLGRQRNKESWEMYPSTVNAYFNPPANEIVFPAGILQPPFFSQKWPGYISYGAFGHVAAHELTHAFDSAGRLYNQNGKLEEWWSNFTSEGFQNKQDCIVKQYSAYTIDDGEGGKVHVNGNLTSGENIGDTGLIQAYRAWKAQYHASLEAGTEYLLPGLHFSREQLFFISFARIWARAMKPAAAVQRIRTDPHSPSQYRVDGTVYNIPEFAEAFKCKKGAKLNPPREKQCVFWS